MADDPFVVSVQRFVARAKWQQEAFLQAVAQDALARVKELTPVRTGYLRANWAVVKGGQAQQLSATKDGSIRAEESLQVITKLRTGDTFVLLNPIVYARRVEFGFTGMDSLGRHYDQKGAFMMTRTIAEMPQIAARALARINRELPT